MGRLARVAPLQASYDPSRKLSTPLGMSTAMERYELVIFDCDGVLVDSEPLASEALRSCLADRGWQLNDFAELEHGFKGRKMEQCLRMVERLLELSLPPGFEDEVRERTAENFRRALKPVPGIADALRGLRVPYCVASSGPPEKIHLSLSLTDLLSYFEGRIFSAYDIGRWKPDPGLFLHTAEVMGVEPNACAVVEDSVAGVQAARAAGMDVYGYANAAAAERLEFAGAVTFSDMSGLPGLLDTRRN